MDGREKAGWLADKICNGGDYAKEAAIVLVRQAEEIERLEEALKIASATVGDLQRGMAQIQYAYDLNEALIGKIQEVVHVIASRPVTHNVKVTGRRRAKPGGNQQRSCWRSG